jgi:pimeloyl-ACP methyl ester carboxylesterase
MKTRITSGLLFFVLAAPAWADSAPTYPPPAEVKASFLKMLDRPKVPLDVKADAPKTEDGLVTEHLTFASEKKADGSTERVTCLIIKPEKADKKLPAIVVLHGTGGSKEGQKGWLTRLAKKGFLVIAIDARYHGERSGGAKGAAAYNAAILRAWRTKSGETMEHPFYYDTCWDLWRTADYLQSRADVDGDRLGMIGFSMGGIQAWLAGSVDARYKVVVPAIAVQSFRWSLENEQWQGRANSIRVAHEGAAKDLGEAKVNQKVCSALWSKVIPGVLDAYDCPSMLRLFAGRSLLIVSGENDKNCPLGGAKIAITSVERAFKDAKAEDRLRVMMAPGVGHSVTTEQQQAAVDWFEKWLKP